MILDHDKYTERSSAVNGLNFQADRPIICLARVRVVMCLESSLNCIKCPHDEVAMQVLDRIRRLGNPSPHNAVYFHRYYVGKTLDDHAAQQVISLVSDNAGWSTLAGFLRNHN